MLHGCSWGPSTAQPPALGTSDALLCMHRFHLCRSVHVTLLRASCYEAKSLILPCSQMLEAPAGMVQPRGAWLSMSLSL